MASGDQVITDQHGVAISSMNDSSWHLDKRIPIAFLAAIVVQTGMALWWAASISARVDQLERFRDAANILAGPQSERLIKVDTKVDAMHEDIIEIKRTLHAGPPIPSFGPR